VIHKTLHLARLLATVALLVSAFASAAMYLLAQRAAWNPINLSADPVTNWEARCEGLRQDLPNHGSFGYVSDWDLPGWSGSTSDMDNEYRLTQYALVPRIIVRGAQQPQVIGNFSREEDLRAAQERFGLRLVRSYGLGIYLLERAGP